MDFNKPVSGRQFARLVGQTEGAVRKAVARGSIERGFTSDKKFIPRIASEEWGKPILDEFLKSADSVLTGRRKKTPSVSSEKPNSVKSVFAKNSARSPDEKVPESYDETVKAFMSEKLPSVSSEEITDEDPEEVSDHVLKSEAERQAAILKVKILRLTYMEKRGEMVPVEKVNAVLFAYGQEIRNAIEGMRYRSLDLILACNTRSEADRVFEKEINETLTLLADVQNRKFEA